MTEKYERAIALSEAGFTLMPIQEDGSKVPTTPWKQFQLNRPPERDIALWFRDLGRDIGIITGLWHDGGRHYVIDFDEKNERGNARKWLEAIGDGDLLRKCYLVRTPSNGYHVHYRVGALQNASPRGNDRLARSETGSVLIELKGFGGYCMAPGLSGYGSYAPLTAKTCVPQLTLLTLDEEERLLGAVRVMNRYVAPVVAFNAEEVDEPHEQRVMNLDVPIAVREKVVRKWLEGRPITIQGEGGSDEMLRATRGALEGGALPEEMAVELLEEYGDRGLPSWSRSEIRHKVSEVLKTPNPRFGWLLPGFDVDAAVAEVVKPAPVIEPLVEIFEDSKPEPSPAKGSKSQASDLKKLVLANAELWHDVEAFATIKRDARKDNVSIRGEAFRGWLTLAWHKATGGFAKPTDLDAVISLIEQMALYEHPLHETHLRAVRPKGERRIFVDLANKEGQVVEVLPGRWRIITDPPVKFLRPTNMAPLPMPTQSNLDVLRPLVNVEDDDWPTIVGFILDCLKGFRPYLVLNIAGEFGSAKSSILRIIKRLVDPVHKSEINNLPETELDLGSICMHEFLLAYDNISKLDQTQSDWLCRIATGGGIKRRKLYTDNEVVVSDYTRPQCMNGIPDIANKQDLISRSVFVYPQRLEKDKQLTDREFHEQLDAALPQAFGAILDLLANGLANEPNIKLEHSPRMADSARWVAACTDSMDFVNSLLENQDEAAGAIIDSSPSAKAIRRLMEKHEEWKGSLQDLIKELQEVTYKTHDDGHLPKTPRSMAEKVRRDAPAMKRLWGIDARIGRVKGLRKVRIDKCDLRPEVVEGVEGVVEE